ncbi:hypothetical protein [Roseomonas rosulenta]|uniref:hypothetical protein n=1 Tax=Roseomonas rosulenta TaxID=2748667 RepID=UPI0018E01C5D|nr:hypothetical protein [Roseomonas rosulenta]
MRLLSLLGVAAQAEGLRLRRTVGMTARRGAWLAAASLFGVAAIGLAHAAAVIGLAPRVGLAAACGIVAVADLVVAGILALVAQQRRDPVAEEALALRRMMLSAAARSPMREAGALVGSAPVLGAMAGEAIAIWLRRR